MEMTERILEVRDLHVSFDIHAGEVQAVRGVDFYLNKGETLAIVGESGSGKSVTTKAITKLFQKDEGRIKKGEILFLGEDLATKSEKELTQLRGKEISMIFQDPYASLNPRLKVMDIVAEGIDIHNLASSRKDRKKRVYDLLETVGLSKEHASRYPHEFSGGQRQRIGIARALAVEPEFIIADEPISALDVSIQAQVVNLLLKLQRERGITFLFIAHDLSMVKYISDRIAVMNRGKIVELGTADEIYNHPLHDYTKSLLSAVPQPDPESERSRKRIEYKNDDALNDSRSLQEVRPGHYVFVTDEEATQLRAVDTTVVN
ncbi:ABC transporter ATP-binding protein [Staphylococcus auricularis]|uniref:ABC transporter ATP-binding protein n=1 Tax=Staphylococcus auricularis TaxID=29379 RepID=A0AAP8PP55_9STAP|nr:ABC transporter ATP-binding protein [Staphylococcus auricularis]PNZ67171.1 ABC transporter ATP-binding protein [Staphylococcus auricularis]SQJ08972.1 oligopeptide transport system ATP-binding protein OppF [Staphylococcus auricularis]